jgi:hypothetical protein
MGPHQTVTASGRVEPDRTVLPGPIQAVTATTPSPLRDFYRRVGWPQVVDDCEYAVFELRGILIALSPWPSSPATAMSNPSGDLRDQRPLQRRAGNDRPVSADPASRRRPRDGALKFGNDPICGPSGRCRPGARVASDVELVQQEILVRASLREPGVFEGPLGGGVVGVRVGDDAGQPLLAGEFDQCPRGLGCVAISTG